MKIIGIDASLTGTGVAILDGSSESTLVIQSKKTGPARLIEIRQRIRDIVAGADLIILEGYAFARPNQAHQIGELGGILRVMFHEMGLQVLEVAPAAVKKFATGKGTAKKEDMAVAIYKRWGKEFGTNDEADAYVLAQIGLAYTQGADGLTIFQREVVDKLRSEGSGRRRVKKAG